MSFLPYAEHKRRYFEECLVPIDFYNIYFPTIEVIGDQQLFGSSKYILMFNKETYTGLEQHEGE